MRVMADVRKKYPVGAENYLLYEEVGQGASASVCRALCVPFDEVVAVKVLDLQQGDLINITRESHAMAMIDNPNVVKSHCSFVIEDKLWLVMPFMDTGSCLHILKAAYPHGIPDEAIIATILREALKGLVYLHDHEGIIHRDVKAGNILVDARTGTIKLGDLGVSACLLDSWDRLHNRNTFTGTPCWMAPEVMERSQGYDFKADIWSFGITALELAHGHAPFSMYPPAKVLIMTLANPPPGLHDDKDRKFSKSFKQLVAMCLVKQPHKRPTAKKLLKHPFFKHAKSSESIVRKMTEKLTLPTLGQRVESMKIKEEELLANKKISDAKREEMSQNKYKQGISEWNFNLDDIKEQASLLHLDLDDVHETINDDKDPRCYLSRVPDSEEKSSQSHSCSMFHSSEDDPAIKEATSNITVSSRARNTSQQQLQDQTPSQVEERCPQQQIMVQNRESSSGEVILPAAGATSAEPPAKAKLVTSVGSGDDIGESMGGEVVQQKGRFKVLSGSYF